MLSINEAKEISKGYDIVPISKEILADVKTPIQVLNILEKESSNCFMLESVEKQKTKGRYTFIGFDPVLEVSCTNNELEVITNNLNTGILSKTENQGCDLKNSNSNEKSINRKNVTHPKTELENILNNYKSPRLEGLPPFTGGLVGYFAYDYLKYAEKALDNKCKEEDEKNKDVELKLFDKVVVFDNLMQKITVIVNIRVENIEQEYSNAIKEIDRIIDLIKNGKVEKIIPGKLKSELKGICTQEQFCEKVERAKEYIHEGDIFQVVLSNRMSAEYEGSLLNAYRVLRTTNPSPYMFYFKSDDVEIIGASPETLVKLNKDTVYTFPLAGTRPRGKDKEEDKALERELLSDEKELAEHNMLVDLGRNDLGKISEFGSVSVEEYMSIERYSHVMHIGSTVKGKILKEKNAFDAIEAVLPAGTLSGAPKIRAMQIIDELEECERGIYGGAIGYIDFSGNMDTCIAIRIAYKKKDRVYVHSGAGIVADSISKNEYQECLNKAKAVKDALVAGGEEL